MGFRMGLMTQPTHRKVCATLPFFFLLASSLQAAAPGSPKSPSLSAPQADTFTLDGKIIKLAPGKFTVSSGENIIFHVVYNDETEFKKADGSEGSAKDLRVGSQVHVEGDLKETGEIVAARIAMQEDAREKP